MSAKRTRRTRNSAIDAAGLMALAVTLLLSWPGVRIAQAGDDSALMSVDPALEAAQAPAAPAEAPSCAVPGMPSTLGDAMVEHQARRMLREIAKRAQAAAPAPAPGQPWIAKTDQGVVLNSRGYNYRPRGEGGPATP